MQLPRRIGLRPQPSPPSRPRKPNKKQSRNRRKLMKLSVMLRNNSKRLRPPQRHLLQLRLLGKKLRG